jgi:serine/threonine protein kinase
VSGHPVEDEPETTGRPVMPRQRAVAWVAASGNAFAGGVDRPDAHELIGDGITGGEGVLWRALDHGLRAPALCAVKMLTRPAWAGTDWPNAPDRELLEQNKRLLKHLSPRNVVRVHEILYGPAPHPQERPDMAAPHVVYVVMDWVEGPTLRQVVAGRRAISGSLMERLKYVGQLAGALADLMPMNANATLHRDIKPGNCIIHEKRGLVLVDITTLRHAGDGFDPAGLHTPEYAAPEVRAAPRRPRTTATEMYSLGAVAASA